MANLTHRRIVIMGVSSCGKSTVGELLSQRVGLPYRDGDDMHPPENIAKMSAGHALDDADRAPWLHSIGRWLAAQEGGAIVGCSALKHSYRDIIRAEAPGTVFVHLNGSYDLLAQRMSARRGHFMPLSLLDSQVETLEPLGAREEGVVLDIAASPEELAGQAAEYLTA
ncbi:MAG: gluconokinase [Actinomycetaceae bacterium]|nr:gluconokinase [Actinomycetaceae bacterium]